MAPKMSGAGTAPVNKTESTDNVYSCSNFDELYHEQIR